MAVKFLDNTGLGYFWSKIKAWCNATFAAITHNQASNTINAMTGYSKPSSGSAISAGDTLNAAVGKLEAKVDAIDTGSYVQKSGDTMSGDLRITKTSPSYILKHTNLTRGTAPSAYTLVPDVLSLDSNGRTMWAIWHKFDTNLSHTIDIACYNGTTIDSDAAELILGFDINGTKYFELNSNLTISKDYPTYICKNTGVTRNTAPASDIYNHLFLHQDSTGKHFSILQSVYLTNKAHSIRLLALKGTTTTSENSDMAVFQLGWDADSIAYATAPSTSSSRNNGTDIVTRDWIPNDTRIVHTSGAETIAGTKTFTNNPYIARDWPVLALKDTSVTRNVAPSSAHTDNWIYYYDSADNPMGRIRMDYNTDKSTYLCLHVYSGRTTDNTYDSIGVGFDANGIAFAIAPSTSTSRTGLTDIVTRDWIPNDTRIVHTSGDEVIGGVKDFSDAVYLLSDVYIKSDQPILRLRDTNNDRTVAPSSADYSDAIIFYDKDYDYLYRIRGGHDTDGSTRMYMLVYKQGATDTTASLGVAFDGSGNSYGYCPTPPANSSTTEIATAAWVNTKLSGVVHTTGNETVSGVETFTNNPMIEKEYPSLEFRLAGTKRSVTPSSAYYWSFLNVTDDAGTPKRFFLFRGTYGTDKSASLYMGVFKGTNTTENSGDSTTLGIGFDASGNAYAWCPTPASSANSTHIATTAWVVAKGYLTSHQSLANCMKVNSTNTVSVFHLARRNANDSGICLSGGNGTDVGAGLQLYGPTATNAGRACLYARSSSQTKQFYATPDGTISWNGQSIHTASDERLKTPIEDVSSDILDVWENVQWGQFKFLEAVDEKGNSARFHVGLVAQAIDRVFKAHGSDVLGYGILCHDVQEATNERLDENGEVLESAHEAFDFWGVRYTEALCMEAAYQRRKNKILENRISELEKQVSDMLQTLQSLKGAN